LLPDAGLRSTRGYDTHSFGSSTDCGRGGASRNESAG